MNLFRHLTANNIKLSPYPFIRELSMEAYLIENESILQLDNDNFSDVEIIEVELALKHARKSKETDGRIDILALYNQTTIGIIELKLGELNQQHLEQLEDYFLEKEQIIRTIDYFVDSELDEKDQKWIGILIGSRIEQSLLEKISNGYLINNNIPLAALTINRYRSEDNQIYVVTDTYFKNIGRNYDLTKYEFNNKILSKNRLVLEVVKKYVEIHPTCTYSSLENVFPPSLQGTTLGVFGTFEEASTIYERTKHKRHFIKSNEIISLIDETKVSICNQWGKKNLPVFIEKAKKLGFDIVPIK